MTIDQTPGHINKKKNGQKTTGFNPISPTLAVTGNLLLSTIAAKTGRKTKSPILSRLFTSHMGICETIYSNSDNSDYNKAAERLAGIVGHYRSQERAKLVTFLAKEEARRPTTDEEVGKVIQERGGAVKPRHDQQRTEGGAYKRPRPRERSTERQQPVQPTQRRKLPPQSCQNKGNQGPPPPPPPPSATFQGKGRREKSPKRKGKPSQAQPGPSDNTKKGKGPFAGKSKGKGKGKAQPMKATDPDTAALMSAIRALVDRVEAN
jgi:hypothetical protein